MESCENAFYALAGPIGNLQDLSFRVKAILEKVDYVFCEDTRVTSKLLKHLNLHKELISCNAHSEQSRAIKALEILDSKKSIAYLSDAGCPGISDPGNLLVKEISEQGHLVIPVPGPSAITCLLSACGFDLSNGFYFCGFLPRQSSKFIKLFEQFSELKIPICAFESPHRIRKSLELLQQNFPEAELCIGRELTKLYEEIIRGKASELKIEDVKEKGEFVLVLKPENLFQKKEKKNKYSQFSKVD
ncbi:MAG TPA: 16S rRNA (cytidine(1402)-2'-O)-methyltransferase [Vampirovibrionales bacterium]